MGFLNKIVAFMPGYQAWRSRTNGGGGLAHASIETTDENGVNNATAALSSLADIRDFVRNTSFGQTVLNQLHVNVVGTVGGQLSFATSDEEFNAKVNKDWARWAKSCNFSDGSSLNRILRDLVGCLFFNGGDALVVFDNGQITGGEGTGKLLVFESDQIANAPDWYFEKHFPASWRQDRGMIYDGFDRPVGFFASKKRGLKELPVVNGVPQFLTFLDKHPDLNPLNRPFCFVSRSWRPNQGRGVAAIMHVINELRNCEDLEKAETAAAKLNSHLGLAIKDNTSASDVAAVNALMNGQPNPSPKVKFDAMLRQQSAILQLPPNKDIVSFDTKRPNDRVLDFIDQLHSGIVAAFGVGKQFYTLTPESSFTAHRGAMQMAWQSIEMIQGDLEKFCDWCASQWFYWRRTKYGADRLDVPEEILQDIDFCTEWAWPTMPEVDSQKHESTISAAMQNGTRSYRDLMGPEWRRSVLQREVERKFFNDHGEVYPGDRMVTGGIANLTDTPNTEGNETDGE